MQDKPSHPLPYACPHCGAVSHHPSDAAERYCGRCHRWAEEPPTPDTYVTELHSECPACHVFATRSIYDLGDGPEVSCAWCEWCWGAEGQPLTNAWVDRSRAKLLELGVWPPGMNTQARPIIGGPSV